jgi:4-amino-4-deoxy-L-arabinose transferase-like glycosyltransferase
MSDRRLLAVILLSYLTVGFYAAYFGFDILAWDDSEFVTQALDTSDRLSAQGLLSWPIQIVRAQHYSKPPLYVNSLALMIQLVGRARVPLAIGTLAVLTSAALGYLVFLLMRRVTSDRYALLSMIAVAGLPGWSRWAPEAFADLELVVCVVWTIVQLSGKPRARWLGTALGLGMLAKITFPAFVGLPLLYWLWKPADRTRRIALLGRALAVAAVVAGFWYLPNLGLATGYVGSSVVNEDRPNVTPAETLAMWLRVLSIEGVSWVLIAAGLVALALYLANRKRDAWPAFPGRVPAMLLSGALPFMLISLRVPSATSRYWLASFVLLALALLIFIHWTARVERVRDTVFSVLVIGVALQWALTLAMQVPWTFQALRHSLAARAVSYVVPGFHELDPQPFQAVNLVMDRVNRFGAAGPRHWYLSGNNTYLNVSRLQVAAKLSKAPVDFDWADYFSWPESQTLDRLRQIAAEPAVVVIAEPLYRDEGSEYLVRRSKFVKARLNEFRLLEANAEFAMYATPQAFDAVKDRVPPPEMNFQGFLRLLSGSVSDHTLTVKVQLLKPLPCSYKVFIHGALDAQPIRVWDQAPAPPFCQWTEGQERTLTFQLPAEYSRENDRIEVGFFDEADAAHNWPPLKLNSGGNSVCFAPGKNKNEVPMRPCRSSG